MPQTRRPKATSKAYAFLKQQGVDTDVHYATPPHLQPCYRQFKSYKLAKTTALANEVVSLPIAHPITVQDAIDISNIINEYKPQS